VTLGTRVAILSRGGVLEQYAPPSEVLSRPASAFVANFLGEDRGIQRLAVTKLRPEDLTGAPHVASGTSFAAANHQMREAGFRFALIEHDDRSLSGWVAREDATDGAEVVVDAREHRFRSTVPMGASLREVLAVLLQHDDGFAAVEVDGRVVGVLTPDDLHLAMGRSAAESTAPIPADSDGAG
jgi:osmoprotectant transport system ATP-binding protein